jgi:hypothetical protein
VDGGLVPSAEIEAAANALRFLWVSEENRRSLMETGRGANYLWQARLALEAALAVRGRDVRQHETEQ